MNGAMNFVGELDFPLFQRSFWVWEDMKFQNVMDSDFMFLLVCGRYATCISAAKHVSDSAVRDKKVTVLTYWGTVIRDCAKSDW